MQDIPVPRQRWEAFCDAFTDQHRGWRVDVRQVLTEELDEPDDVAVPLPDGKPLQEVRSAPENDELLVTLGEGSDEATLLVPDAEQLFERRTDDAAAHAGLRIDGFDGRTTLVAFRAPARPETLDGVAPGELS